jgi:hypothetical protein
MTIADLTQRVQAVLERSPLSNRVKGVAIEPVDFDDDEVLRVTIKVSKPDSVKTEEALLLLQSIHDELSELDDRFPSVRFAEAA